jgi:hypothetical protein
MRKQFLIIAVLTIAALALMAAPAFADHSPTFYVAWDGDSSYTGYVENFGNAGTGGPHSNYLEGTEKCGVCHSVHRAPVPGVKWDTNPSVEASSTAVAGGQYQRQEFTAPTNAAAGYTTQMLLQTNVANSCDYCHISTSVGGKQLYAGKASLRSSEWNEGFAHGNACTGCHVVHGVGSNYGKPALYGSTGTFKGPLESKALKLRAKGAGGAGDLGYYWQDETIAIGSLGKAELATSTITGMAAWAAPQTPADYAGGGWVSEESLAVDPLNVPLFPSAADAINGTNVRPGTDAKKAQSAVFCTFCHANYGYASEAMVNPDGDKSLFQGQWYAQTTVPNVDGTPVSPSDHTAAGVDWKNANNGGAQTMPFKNHPVKSVDGNFVAAGKAGSVPGQVAFAGAETCVSCHDAGPSTGAEGVLVQSYPHFTPGYFHFVKSASYVGDTMSNAPPIPDVIDFANTAEIASVQAWLEDPVHYEESTTVQDGQCLKCHVNAANDAGVGKTY